MLAVPGTGPRVAGAVPPRPHAHVARATARHALPRLAARIPSAQPAGRARKPAVQERSGPERSVQPVIATVATRTVSRALSNAPPSRVESGRRAGSIRPEAGPTETLAFVAPHRKCRTCFGPLRSPDDMPEQTLTAAKTVAAAAGASAAAVVADDSTSGPVDLGSGLIWYRLPARVQGP
jgi:hypothetical protein